MKTSYPPAELMKPLKCIVKMIMFLFIKCSHRFMFCVCITSIITCIPRMDQAVNELDEFPQGLRESYSSKNRYPISLLLNSNKLIL